MQSFSVSSVFIKSAVCLTSALCASAVHANASATASLSNVRFTLSDLDPLDGITPWITFDMGANSAMELNAEIIGADQLPTSVLGDAPFGNLSGVISAPNASAHGDVVNAGSDSQVSLISASVSAVNGWSATSTVNVPGFPFGFTLSPQTAIRLEAELGEVSASVADGDGIGFASAEATLQIWKNNGSWPIKDSVYVDVLSQFQSANIYVGQAQATSVNGLAVSLSNATGASISGGMLASANAWAQSSATAAVVPEPGSVALMVLGLGAIGLRRHMRRVQAASH